MGDLKNNNKNQMQVAQQIFHNLLDITEAYPRYSISQHLAAIFRRKKTEGDEFFHWSDKELLKRVEQHKKELAGEELMMEKAGEE